MKILITNDDGINAPVLPHLIKWAMSLGEVTVVAPKVEQSGKSHAIDFTRPIEIKRVPLVDGAECWYMDSTPADCVRFAVLGMKREYDLIISGINRGFNLGKDIVYSGTCGAIFEGARLGINGIALSTDPKDFLSAVESLTRIYNEIKEKELFKLNPLYNINIPIDAKDIYYTRQGGIYFTDEFVHIGNDMYEQTGDIVREGGKDFTLDTDTVRNGHISITPLMATRTNEEALRTLLSK